MALLSDGSIRKMVDLYDAISPFNEKQLQPCSYDVKLGSKIIRYVPSDVDFAKAYIDGNSRTMHHMRRQIDDVNGFMLYPGEFVLGSTEESVSIPNGIACRFEGKSSMGRIGLLTHVTAGFIDPGFYGQITLEITNMNSVPIKLYQGMRIGQLCFFRLDHDAECVYGDSKLGSHYQGQTGPTEVR